MRRLPLARYGRELKLCLVAVLVMTIMVELHLAAPELPWARRLELVAVDLQFRLRGSQKPGSDIAIIMIDDRTVAELGRWPLPRRKFAKLLDILRDANAKVVALDVLFAEPEPGIPEATREALSAASGRLDERDRAKLSEEVGRLEDSGDEDFAEAIRRSGNVVLPFTFRFGGQNVSPTPGYAARAAFSAVRMHEEYRPLELRPAGLVMPIARLADAAAALGHSLILYDVDGSPRYDYPAIEYDLDEYPSMAVRIAQLFLRLAWPEVRLELGRGIAFGTLGVETDAAMRLGVNYRGPTGTFPTYSFAQVIAGGVPPSTFRDRIVLVGVDALGVRDAFRTPFTASLPGVERLATILDTMIRGNPLRRPAYAPWLEALCMLGIALAIGFAMARLSIASATLVVAALLIAGEAAAQVAFVRSAIWYSGAVPGMATVITFGAVLLYRYGLLDKDYRRLRHSFARYLPPTMVERLANSGKFPELGGELREITVMFCDLRGFSRLAERLNPQALTRLVNDFLTAATEAVHAHGGTIDKYIGDAVMALWNAPLDQPDHAELACRAALTIGERLKALNAHRALAGAPPLMIGIGIDTGFCTVGNFGSKDRHDYSAIGNAVNIAARLEGETKNFGVTALVGPQTAARIPGFATLPIAIIRVRGRTQEIEISALIGDEEAGRDPGFAGLRRQHVVLCDAVSARDWERAAALAAELATVASADCKPIYERLMARIGQSGKTTETS
jgi:adenylate cyclase